MTTPGSEKSPAESSATKDQDGLSEVVPAPTKTPFYQAVHAVRYQRQALIKQIETETGRQLMCYVAGPGAPIDRDDVVAFVDLLHNIVPERDLDLLLQTGGGDIDAAEKLISLTRTKVKNAVLRVIVPDYAKSAGTLMTLGADLIVMSDTSELGPIDPQCIRADQKGNRMWHSIQNYLDAYEAHSAALKKDPDDKAAQIMLSSLSPETVKLFEATKERARALAEDLLKQGMFRNGGNWSQTASELLDTKRWQSHNQMITHSAAQDPRLGLSVEVLPSDSEQWQGYWQLYCLQRLAIKDNQKLFESSYASLLVDGPL